MWLVEQGVRVIGIDACALGRPFASMVADYRRRSPAHLIRWYHLVGYCLRPGFGDPLDRFRVEQLWKLMHAPPRAEPGRPLMPRTPEGGADYPKVIVSPSD